VPAGATSRPQNITVAASVMTTRNTSTRNEAALILWLCGLASLRERNSASS
jgi:hypothetical protein